MGFYYYTITDNDNECFGTYASKEDAVADAFKLYKERLNNEYLEIKFNEINEDITEVIAINKKFDLSYSDFAILRTWLQHNR